VLDVGERMPGAEFSYSGEGREAYTDGTGAVEGDRCIEGTKGGICIGDVGLLEPLLLCSGDEGSCGWNVDEAEAGGTLEGNAAYVLWCIKSGLRPG